ncbi:hypothetical protein JAAARDRAFT_380235 [Jaapia argillacea MUCL 33604]|uniref:Uncharacterized protein n=1 Tax=Jaapia argillacea MUCL 33604 TaxID=933084 RepID=A0A067Q8X4_9AGAM|nr:hypothetical protein JAAARDRAFT_380235 [Jaapia argillacea MUCL 33604]
MNDLEASPSSTTTPHRDLPTSDDKREAEAAARIQRAWRDRGMTSAHARWNDAAVHTRMKLDRTAADKGKNDVQSRWARAVFSAGRLQDDDKTLSQGGFHDPDRMSKILETQHWLELIDGKHRYGSNRPLIPPPECFLPFYTSICSTITGGGGKKTLQRISSTGHFFQNLSCSHTFLTSLTT